MSFRVTIVRHAETDLNRDLLIHSYGPGNINAAGVKQAELLGHNLANEKFTHIYSSDSERTQTTAKVLLSKSLHSQPTIVLDKRLREKNFGEWEGLPGKVLFDAAREAGVGPHEVTPPGGETFQEVVSRMKEFLKDLFAQCDNSTEDQNILIVTHGLWIMFFLGYLKRTEEYDLENLDRSPGAHRAPINTCKTQFTVSKCNNNEVSGERRKLAFSCTMDATHLGELAVTANYDK